MYVLFLLHDFTDIYQLLYIQVWSSELATVAQNYAEKCVYGHNPHRTKEQSTYGYVGENIYYHTGFMVNFTDVLAHWFAEKKYYYFYGYSTVRCSAPPDSLIKGCGHYTQVRRA